jgi:hypothetical protein
VCALACVRGYSEVANLDRDCLGQVATSGAGAGELMSVGSGRRRRKRIARKGKAYDKGRSDGRREKGALLCLMSGGDLDTVHRRRRRRTRIAGEGKAVHADRSDGQVEPQRRDQGALLCVGNNNTAVGEVVVFFVSGCAAGCPVRLWDAYSGAWNDVHDMWEVSSFVGLQTIVSEYLGLLVALTAESRDLKLWMVDPTMRAKDEISKIFIAWQQIEFERKRGFQWSREVLMVRKRRKAASVEERLRQLRSVCVRQARILHSGIGPDAFADGTFLRGVEKVALEKSSASGCFIHGVWVG